VLTTTPTGLDSVRPSKVVISYRYDVEGFSPVSLKPASRTLVRKVYIL
jgi:hypothetical protein